MGWAGSLRPGGRILAGLPRAALRRHEARATTADFRNQVAAVSGRQQGGRASVNMAPEMLRAWGGAGLPVADAA